MNKPLKDITVLDLTQAYSGPFCTMHLADHGAEVIKVESPYGDQSRNWTPIENDYSAYYAYINRNKKGMKIDLKKEEGKQILRELISKVDVVCENFRVGTFEKLGFSFEELKRINPKIIYGSISGFGLEGPLSKRPCYDIVAQAMSGMMSVTGHEDREGVKVGPSIADNYSGTYLSLGICMALYQREKTGEAQRLDVSMLDTMFSIMENFVVSHTVSDKVLKRMGNVDSGIAPFDSFTAKDGSYVVGCGTDRFWAKLCVVMEKPELIDDPRYLTNSDRMKNYLPDLKNIIQEWSGSKTVAEIEEKIVDAGIPFGPVLNINQISSHPQIEARNMLWEVEDPGIGKKIKIPGTPIKMHGKEDAAKKAAPLLGEDNENILRELLGYTYEKIEDFKSNNII